VQVPRSPLAESPYQTEMRHFTDHLADGAPFLTDGDEATRSLALTLAVRESVRTGRAIPFTDGWPALEEPSAISHQPTPER
jgi:predicted dehydrogenase